MAHSFLAGAYSIETTSHSGGSAKSLSVCYECRGSPRRLCNRRFSWIQPVHATGYYRRSLLLQHVQTVLEQRRFLGIKQKAVLRSSPLRRGQRRWLQSTHNDQHQIQLQKLKQVIPHCRSIHSSRLPVHSGGGGGAAARQA